MTADEIRKNWNLGAMQTADLEWATASILQEMCAQLAELNSNLEWVIVSGRLQVDAQKIG